MPLSFEFFAITLKGDFEKVNLSYNNSFFRGSQRKQMLTKDENKIINDLYKNHEINCLIKDIEILLKKSGHMATLIVKINFVTLVRCLYN